MLIKVNSSRCNYHRKSDGTIQDIVGGEDAEAEKATFPLWARSKQATHRRQNITSFFLHLPNAVASIHLSHHHVINCEKPTISASFRSKELCRRRDNI